MTSITKAPKVTIGVLALQGAFREHLMVLRQAAGKLATKRDWSFIEVRTAPELESCDALIIPGGESTAISLIAKRTNLLEPLRSFVKLLELSVNHRVSMKPTWGTCAGLILLAEATNGSKDGGQELIGGLDILVNRNHFGRQIESFEAELDLSFLGERDDKDSSSPLKPAAAPFRALFIRAPIVENILHPTSDAHRAKPLHDNTTTAIKSCAITRGPVEVLARLPAPETQSGAIVAVKQANIFGTSFHPELTDDIRIHVWWLEQVLLMIDQRRSV